MKHYLECNAPICQDSIEPDFKNETIWYAGEEVCQKSPYQKFQKKQIDINKGVKAGTFRNTDVPLTAHDLETRLI